MSLVGSNRAVVWTCANCGFELRRSNALRLNRAAKRRRLLPPVGQPATATSASSPERRVQQEFLVGTAMPLPVPCSCSRVGSVPVQGSSEKSLPPLAPDAAAPRGAAPLSEQ